MSLTASFFHEIAKPTADEFLADIADVRRGRLAAIVLYHVADYWYAENPTAYAKLQDVHLEVISLCPEFQTIRDVADASKHAELTIKKGIARTITTAQQVQMSEGIFAAPFGQGVFNEAMEVVVRLDDGSTVSLAIAVNTVLGYWWGRV